MPSKNEIASAKVAHLARHGGERGAVTGPVTVDMATVRRRKREMVDRQIAQHLQMYRQSGAELIMGSGSFPAAKTLEVKLTDGGTRVLEADKVFLNVGTHAAIPNLPGLKEAGPLTHVEALELEYLPRHLIVVGGGYSGLELAQAYHRFGAEVAIVEAGPQLRFTGDAANSRRGGYSGARRGRAVAGIRAVGRPDYAHCAHPFRGAAHHRWQRHTGRGWARAEHRRNRA
jgi:pyruvate/2-oxoglutarate dehydrogenase complex dihydrolipoamide dehydrogenase (E3) component